ncbi:hypothetical protein PMAYCL1PPCAC_19604, partial [Pristionchus mayeri]
LTVPNAEYVIDCGQQKIPSEYTMDGLRNLETIPIDDLMIEQRAGRTGRDTYGEYFLPYPMEKVEEMMKKSQRELMLNREFDERHLLYKKLYKLRLLYEPPERLTRELLTSMEIRGLYNEADGITKDVILLNSLLNFLSPELARLVIQGVRLGISEHIIYLVAHSISRIKFCQTGSAARG